MKLVYIAPFAFSPKATVSARMLPMAEALANRGHQVTILVPPYDYPTDSGKCYQVGQVTIENLNVDTHTSQFFNYMKLGWKLAARAKQLGADAIHVFKPIGPSGIALWQLHSSGERPILDTDDWEGRGGWADVNPYPPLMKLAIEQQERWGIRHARAVTCASQVLVERSHGFGQLQKSIHLMPNGPAASLRSSVDQAISRRQELRRRFGWLKHQVVIYAGTVPLNSDLDIAVKAMIALRTRDIDYRWVVIATGDGLSELKRTISRAGLDDFTEYHGFMPHEQLVERLVAADIGVYPYRDTNINRAKCSGKVVDYMACGLPVVVSDVGMNAVYVEHERSGYLTEPGNADAFGAALLKLMSHPDFSRQMGLAAQRRIWENFSWETRVGELETIYTAASP
ncbi:MAG TPA: glycosyltransferase family 4 protein [Anaerolineae bacterium]